MQCIDVKFAKVTSMPIPDPRGALVHLFDHHVDALVKTVGREPTDMVGEVAALNDLAGALADSLAIWRPIIARLAQPSGPALDIRRAGGLVIECVFDELLDPPACQVLAAAFDLAASRS